MDSSMLVCRLVLPVAALAVGCTSGGAKHLDTAAQSACAYGYLAGVGQMQKNVLAQDRGLLDAYGAARTSGNSVVREWVSAHAELGTGAKKEQSVADSALLNLLQVCRGLGWKAPVSGTASPGTAGGAR